MILCKVKPDPDICQDCLNREIISDGYYDCSRCGPNNEIYELLEVVEMDHYKVKDTNGAISYVPASRIWDIVDYDDDLK